MSMTEEEWLACADPVEMLERFELRLSTRKRRQLTDERLRRAVEVAELYAEGEVTDEVLADADKAAEMLLPPEASRIPLPSVEAAVVWCCAMDDDPDAEVMGQYAARNVRHVAPGEAPDQVDLLRCIFGPLPFRHVTVTSGWLTRPIPSLAQAASDDRALPSGALDPARLAVLSDALEEAGCDDAELLGHLRSAGPHVRGCWALDLILGKS